MDHIDARFQELEQEHMRAVTKILFRGRGPSGWSGFVVNVDPCIIMTVAHPVNRFSHDQILALDTFSVKFFENDQEYDARALKYNFGSDLLILRCFSPPPLLPVFTFADPTTALLSSTTVMCISHPDQRDWIRLRGTICREPFEIGVHAVYNHDMLVFDHDAQAFPGSSGAPIIKMTGQVVGMQLTEACVKEHGICVSDTNRRNLIAEYANAGVIATQVKEFSFRPCNLKQALTVQYLQVSLGQLFNEEAVGPDNNLNNYLRKLVVSFIMRQARRGPLHGEGSKQLQVPSSRKKRMRKTLLQSKMGCEGRPAMDFPTRIRSALGAGAAKGLASLHEDCNPEILFRHVKAANILLNAKAFDPNSTSLCIYESAGALVSSSDLKKVLINEWLSGAAVLDVSAKATIKEVLELSPSHQAVVPDSTLLCILESAGALVSSGDTKKVLTDEWLSVAAALGVPAKATIKEVLGLSPSHQAVVPESTLLCIHEPAGALASSNDTKKVLIDEWLSGTADFGVSAKVTIKEVLVLLPSHQAVGTDSALLCIHESAGALASSSDTKRVLIDEWLSGAASLGVRAKAPIKEVVSFDLDESIASHQTKVEKRVDAMTEIDEAGEMNGELKDHHKDLKIAVIAREGHVEQYSPIHNVQERRG